MAAHGSSSTNTIEAYLDELLSASTLDKQKELIDKLTTSVTTATVPVLLQYLNKTKQLKNFLIISLAIFNKPGEEITLQRAIIEMWVTISRHMPKTLSLLRVTATKPDTVINLLKILENPTHKELHQKAIYLLSLLIIHIDVQTQILNHRNNLLMLLNIIENPDQNELHFHALECINTLGNHIKSSPLPRITNDSDIKNKVMAILLRQLTNIEKHKNLHQKQSQTYDLIEGLLPFINLKDLAAQHDTLIPFVINVLQNRQSLADTHLIIRVMEILNNIIAVAPHQTLCQVTAAGVIPILLDMLTQPSQEVFTKLCLSILVQLTQNEIAYSQIITKEHIGPLLAMMTNLRLTERIDPKNIKRGLKESNEVKILEHLLLVLAIFIQKDEAARNHLSTNADTIIPPLIKLLKKAEHAIYKEQIQIYISAILTATIINNRPAQIAAFHAGVLPRLLFILNNPAHPQTTRTRAYNISRSIKNIPEVEKSRAERLIISTPALSFAHRQKHSIIYATPHALNA